MRRTPLVLVVLAMLAAGCGEEPQIQVPQGAGEDELLSRLAGPEAAVRRRSAEGLGRLGSPSLAVIRALIEAQHDDDSSVATAALEALDRIEPPEEVAERIQAQGKYQRIEFLHIAPAYIRWVRQECEGDDLAKGEELEACWLLVEVPAAYEARVKHWDPVPGVEIPEPEESGRHAWRLSRGPRGGPDSALPTEEVPEGVPAEAQLGEVWCRIASPTGLEWRRTPSCEAQIAPPR